MSLSIDQLPENIGSTWTRLRDELLAVLGENLVALWAYGARIFPDPPRSLGDHDTLAILQRTPDQEVIQSIRSAHESIQEDLAVSLDTAFLLVADAARQELPPRAWGGRGRLENWAFNRAHLLAGRYVLLHGTSPDRLVPAPAWNELEEALRLELDHLERHVAAGDDDPYEASYAMFNGSRILYSIEKRDVVISKRAGGEWAIKNLPARWHGGIRAAGRAYDGEASSEDEAHLRETMAPFVAMVRERWLEHTKTPQSQDLTTTQ